jgi:TonB-linked SusC/RagA family outer membrane protein
MKKKHSWGYNYKLLPIPKKILLIMKLSILLTCIFSANLIASVYSQQARFYLDIKDQSVRDILKTIEKESQFRFFYNDEFTDLDKKLTFSASNQSIDDLMSLVLDNTEVSYTVLENNFIVITPKSLFQQQKVTGRVTDAATGEPLPGVNILVEGTMQGVITDGLGKYSLGIEDQNVVLIFSYVGYISEKVAVSGKSVIDVKLSADIKQLEEVVVIGYGTQKRKELTSAITSVRKEDFNKGPIANSPLQLVQGKIPGLGISRSNGGDPMQEIQMQIRGVSTVMGNRSPLVVIDGVPGGNLNTIAPEDIESIDVLRDGSASAIYGTRGSNGVVIVTSKKGKIGSPTIEYSSYVYYERYNNRPEVLNASEWRQLKTDFANSDNPILKNKAESIIDYGGNTDWFDAISQNKLSQVHNLSISGGSQMTNYYAAINYRDIEGLIKRSFNNTVNYRLALSQSTLKDKLVFDLSLSNTYRKSRPSDYGMFTSAMLRNPTFPVYNADGTFHQEADLSGGNLIAQIYQYENDQKRNDNLVIAKATLNVTDALKLSVHGALQRYNDIAGEYYYRNSYASVIGGYRDLNGEANRTSRQSIDRTFETTITYDKLLNDLHRVNLVGGYSYQDFESEGFGANNRNFISDAFTYNNLNAGLALSSGVYKDNDVWSVKTSSKLIAFFARAIYSYKDKYMLTAGVRREGSSKFGKNDKWGFFPSITGGWRISEENFLKNNSVISDLKLRIGYGITGNQGIGEYVSLERLSPGGMMLFNGQWITGYSPSSNPNPNLRWEKKAETDIGIDFGMYKNRLIINLDLYDRTTSDLLFEYAVPVPPNLYSTLWTNVGGIKNRGIELGINVIASSKAKFKWNTNFNFSYNRNKLISLSNDIYKTKFQDLEDLGAPGLGNVNAYRLEEGQPIGNMYGYAFAGFTDNGEWLFWDKNNENKIRASEAQYSDKRVIGNGLPKYWLGFTNNFIFGHFDASVLVRGAFGFDILNVKRLFYENRKLIPSNILKSGLSSPVIDDPQLSDYYVEKGDYVKLDYVNIGYTIPFKSKILNNTRVYFATNNLLTFTGYKGQDPEVEINGLTPGFDRKENSGRDYVTDYPSTRTFSLGCSIKF